MNKKERDITSTVLAVLFLGGLIVTSLWIVRPFIGPMVWAATPAWLSGHKVYLFSDGSIHCRASGISPARSKRMTAPILFSS